MKTSSSRPASALLMTLLVLIAISGTILTVTKLVLSSSRVGSDQQDYLLASRAADTAIQQGLLITKNGGLTAGVSVSQSGTEGFSGATCGTLVSGSTVPTCPSISGSISPTLSVTASNGTILGDSDLPLNTGVSFDVSSSAITTLKVSGVGVSIHCQTGFCSGGTYGNGDVITVPSGSSTMTLDRTAGALASVGITSASSSLKLTQLDYDCVQVTGTSGNVSVTKRARVYYDASGTMTGVTVLEGSGCQDHLP